MLEVNPVTSKQRQVLRMKMVGAITTLLDDIKILWIWIPKLKFILEVC